MTIEMKEFCESLIGMKKSVWVKFTNMDELAGLASEALRMDELLKRADRLISLYIQDASDGRAMECVNWVNEYREIK